MSERDMVMTYETLFELLQLEKRREDIQQLESDFYEKVLSYLCNKKNTFEQKQSQQLLFERDDKEKARLELENVKKILKDLYDRREKKILNIALNKSRSGISLVNISAMLPSEQALYNSINSTLSDFRKDTLFKLVSGELPCPNNRFHASRPIQSEDQKNDSLPSDVPNSIPADHSQDFAQQTPTDSSTEPVSTVGEPLGHSAPPTAAPAQDVDQTKELKTNHFLKETSGTVKKVRFLTPIDEIIGPDLQIYGPFDSGAVKELPKDLATVLIEKRQAEEV